MMNNLRNHMKGIMVVIVIAFLLSTFLMYEGRSTRRAPGRNADGSMTDYEVAQINGRSLMRSELEIRLRNYLENYGSRNTASLDMAAIYQAVLDQAVLESQLAKEVDERGIRVSDAEAEQAMKDYADRYYPTRETFYQTLAQSGIKIEDYKRTLARQMANEQLIRDEIGEVEVSEDKALEFYDTMKNLIYSKPEGFMIHLADFNTSSDARAFYDRLAGGADWAEVVSDDTLDSGDVINITREPVFLPSTALSSGTLSPLSSLDVGQVSPVFEVSSFDFAVGLKTEQVPATVSPYDEVSADIRVLLRQQGERQKLNEYEASLMSKAQLVINDPSLFARSSQSEEEEDDDGIAPEISLEENDTSDTEETNKANEPENKTSVESPSNSETTEETAVKEEAVKEEIEDAAEVSEDKSEEEKDEDIAETEAEAEKEDEEDEKNDENNDDSENSEETSSTSTESDAEAEETINEPVEEAISESTVNKVEEVEGQSDEEPASQTAAEDINEGPVEEAISENVAITEKTENGPSEEQAAENVTKVTEEADSKPAEELVTETVIGEVESEPAEEPVTEATGEETEDKAAGEPNTEAAVKEVEKEAENGQVTESAAEAVTEEAQSELPEPTPEIITEEITASLDAVVSSDEAAVE